MTAASVDALDRAVQQRLDHFDAQWPGPAHFQKRAARRRKLGKEVRRPKAGTLWMHTCAIHSQIAASAGLSSQCAQRAERLQTGSYGVSAFAEIPHYSKLHMMARPVQHMGEEGLLKDQCAFMLGGTTSLGLSPAARAKVSMRSQHIVLTSAHHCAAVDPLQHLKTMKIDEGALLLDSTLGYMVHGLRGVDGGPVRRHDLETMTCAPLVQFEIMGGVVFLNGVHRRGAAERAGVEGRKRDWLGLTGVTLRH